MPSESHFPLAVQKPLAREAIIPRAVLSKKQEAPATQPARYKFIFKYGLNTYHEFRCPTWSRDKTYAISQCQHPVQSFLGDESRVKTTTTSGRMLQER